MRCRVFQSLGLFAVTNSPNHFLSKQTKIIMKIEFVLVVSATLLVCNLLVGCDKSDQQPKQMEESKKQQERVIALHDQLKSEQGFTLELAKNDDGLDTLVIRNVGLPATENGAYQIYVCWLDEPAAPGGWPLEKRMELIGRQSGHGKIVAGETSTTSSGEVTSTILLNANYTELGDYYGRGRVCVMAVSGKDSYLTNIVTVPEGSDETASHQAKKSQAGEGNSAIAPSKTSTGDGK